MPILAPETDGRQLDISSLSPEHREGWVGETISFLRREFDFLGLIGESHFKSNLDLVFERIPQTSAVFVLTPTHRWPYFAEMGRWAREAATRFSNVTVINVDDYIHAENERSEDMLHTTESCIIGSTTTFWRVCLGDVRCQCSLASRCSGPRPSHAGPDKESLNGTSVSLLRKQRALARQAAFPLTNASRPGRLQSRTEKTNLCKPGSLRSRSTRHERLPGCRA
jgi:hypothetical protein